MTKPDTSNRSVQALADTLSGKQVGVRISLLTSQRWTLCAMAGGLAVRLASAAVPAPSTLPGGGVVTAGSASIGAPVGGSLLVRQTSEQAVINWNSFDVGAQATLRFNQPSASASVLNRVLSNEPTQILGQLSANGKVYIVNPSGVVFGAGARVDASALVASTLRLADADFLAGRERFTDGGSGVVRNAGQLQVAAGGSVALLGASVENSGSISAPGGRVMLASGAALSLPLSSSGLITLELAPARTDATVVNATGGQIAAAGGVIILAAGADSAAAAQVRNDGRLAAAGGAVTLGATQAGRLGETLQHGAIDVSDQAGTGGTVRLLGDRVGLFDGSVVLAGGVAGGGTVLVGGEPGTQEASGAATALYMAPQARIDASAMEHGAGGKVSLWSQGYTGFYGSVAARGGASGGDGGFVETSSSKLLHAFGTVDAAAPRGRPGTWLLDPTDVAIVSGAVDSNESLAGGIWTPSSNVAQIGVANINADLNAGTSVVINTSSAGAGTGNITQGSGVLISKTAGGNATLTMNAAGAITLDGGISASSGVLTTTLNAGGGIGGAGNFATNGGLLTINAGGNGLLSGVISGTGGLTHSGTGTTTLTGTNTYTGATAVNAGTLSIGNGGTSGKLASASDVAVAQNGTVIWNNNNAAANATVANKLSGAGTVRFQGQNSSSTTTFSRYPLTGDNSGLSGVIQVNGARLDVAAASALGTATLEIQQLGQLLASFTGATLTNPIIIQQNAGWWDSSFNLGALRVEGSNTFSGNVLLNDTSLMVLGGTDGLHATFCSYNGGSNTFSGVISGPGGFKMSRYTGNFGTSNVTFSGTSSNTYTGTTVVDGQLINSSLTLAKTNNAVAIAANNVVQMGNATTSQSNLRMSGDNQFGSGVTMNFVNSTNNWGRFDLMGTSQSLAGVTGGTVSTASAGIIQDGGYNLVTNTDATLTLTGSGNYFYYGYVRNQDNGAPAGKLKIIKNGSGSQSFSGNLINYSGSTLINNGTLDFNNSSGVNYATPITVAAGAVLSTSGSSNLGTTGLLTLNGGTYNHSSSGFVVFLNGLTVAADSVMNVSNSGSNNQVFIDGATLSGGGNLTINNTGSGTTATTGVNFRGTAASIYAGALTVNGGSIGTQGNVFAFDNADVTLNGANWYMDGSRFATSPANDHAKSLNGNGTVYAGTYALTLGTNNGSGNFSGNIVGSGATITKVGTGTQILSGANSYTGATTVNVGTLQIGNCGTSGTLGTGAVTNNANLKIFRSDAYTIANAIGGTGSLTQAGSGTSTLTGTNTYLGATLVNAGTLAIGNGGTSGALAADSAVTVASGATMQWNNNNNAAGTTTVTISNPLSGAGTVWMQGQNSDTSKKYSAYLLRGNNSGLTGPLVINGARVDVDANSHLGNGAIEIQQFGQLYLSAAQTRDNPITIQQNAGWWDTSVVIGAIRSFGTTTLNGDVVLNDTSSIVAGDNSGLHSTFGIYEYGSTTFNGVISGPGGFKMSRQTSSAPAGNTANVTFAGASSNTYTGTTVVDGQSALASLTLAKTGGALAIAANNTVQLGSATTGQANLRMGADNQFGAGVTLNFANTAANPMRFDLLGTSQSLAGITAGTASTAAGAIIQDGGYNLGTSSDATLTLTGSGNTSYNGTLRNQDTVGGSGLLKLVKSGTGSQTLVGNLISYSGATTLNAGTLDFNSGVATSYASPWTVAGGAILSTSGTGNLSNAGLLTLNGGSLNQTSSGTLSFNAGLTVSANSVINVSDNGSGNQVFINGATLSGAGNLTINNAGNAVTGVNFAGTAASSYAGALTVNGGSIATQGNVFAFDNADVTLNGASWYMDGSRASMTAANDHARSLNGNGTVYAGASTLTLGSNNGSGNFSGNIVGTGANLIKVGSGTQILTGANSYTGTTTVSAGTLQVGNGGSSGTLGTGAVTDNANLVFTRADGYTINNTISGSGTMSASAGAGLTIGGAINLADNVSLSAGVGSAVAGPAISNGNVTGGDVVLNAAVSASAAGKTVSIYSGNASSAAYLARVAGSASSLNKGYATVAGAGTVDPSKKLNVFYRLTPTANVSVSASDKVYDANSVAQFTLGTPTSIDGDTLTASASGASFAGPNVVAGAAVTLSGVNVTSAVAGQTVSGYQVSPSAATASITPAPLTITAVANTRSYDGTLTAAALPLVAGLQGADSVSALGEHYADKNAGSAKTLLVNAGYVVNDGNAGANYTVSTLSAATGVIQPAALTVTASAASKVYDGTLGAAGSLPLVGALVAGDVLAAPGQQAFVDIHAGVGKTVQASGVVLHDAGGADMSANYAINYVASNAGVITPAALTVTANNDAKFVTQADVANYAGASYSGFVNGEGAGVLGGTLAITRSNGTVHGAGDYPGVLHAGGLTTSDYVISYVAGDYSIVPANTLLVRLTDISTVYGAAAVYGVSSARYMLPDSSIVNLSSSLAGGVVGVNDGVGGSISFPIVVNAAAYSGAGALQVGSYGLGSGTVTGSSVNFGSNLSVQGTRTVTPLAAALQVGGVSKTYDGGTGMAAMVLDVAGKLAGDVLTVAGSGSYATKNAGSGLAYSVNGVALGGADAANYVLNGGASSYSGSDGVITRAPLTLSAVASNKVYDATSTAPAPQVAGLQGSDTISGLSASYADRHAGSGKTVAVNGGYVLNDGNGGANYTVSTVDYTAGVITPAPLTLTAPGASKTYDGTLAAAAPQVAGLLGSDSVSGLGASYADRHAGSGKTVSVNGGYLINDGNGGANYSVTTFASTAGSITPAALTLTAVANTRTYDGSLTAAALPLVSGLQGSDTVSGLAQHYADKHAGSGKTLLVNAGYVVNDGNGGADYTVSTVSTAGGVIQPAALTVTAIAVSKAYDGTLSASGTLPQVGPLVAGDVLAAPGQQAFSDPHAGVGKTVQASGVVLRDAGGADMSANYAINYVASNAGVITPVNLTVTANHDAKFVTKTDAANFAGASYAGFVYGEGPGVLGGGLTITRSNAGVQGAGDYAGVLQAGGLSSGDYVISYVAGDYSIVPANTLLVRLSDLSAMYGATPSYGVTSASYMLPDTSIVTLAASVAGGVVGVDDGSGGGISFPVLVNGAAYSGSGTLKVGNYQLGAGTVTGNSANFSNNMTVLGARSVDPLAVNLAGGGVSKIYDGATGMTGLTLSLTGKLAGDAVTVSGSGSYASKHVGTGLSYTLSGLALAGADAANYVLNGGASGFNGLDGVITRAPLTLSAAGASKVYDASVTASTPQISGLQPGDSVSALSASYASAHAGSGKVVTVNGGYVLNDGNGGANYSVSIVNASDGVITPAALMLTPQGSSKVYDATTASSGTPLALGLRGTDTVTGLSQYYAERHAGSGKLLHVASGYTVNDGNGGANYTVSTTSAADGTITPAPLSLVAQANSRSYDGSTAAAALPLVRGLLEGDSVSGLAERYADKNAGTGKTLLVSAYQINDGNGGANYTVSSVAHTGGVITPAPLTLQAQDVTKTYDASTSTSVRPTVSGLLGDDTVSALSEHFSDAHAGSGKTLTVDRNYQIQDGNGGANYTVSVLDSTHGTITPAPLTLAAVAESKTYDRGTDASATPLALGLQGSDTVTALSQSYTDRNAGTGKTLTVNPGYVVHDGNGGANYVVRRSDNPDGVILPRVVTVSAPDNVSKLADGDNTVPLQYQPILSNGLGEELVGARLTFATPEPGTGKQVNVSDALINDGNHGANYRVLLVPSLTGVIQPRPDGAAASAMLRSVPASMVQVAVDVPLALPVDGVASGSVDLRRALAALPELGMVTSFEDAGVRYDAVTGQLLLDPLAELPATLQAIQLDRNLKLRALKLRLLRDRGTQAAAQGRND